MLKIKDTVDLKELEKFGFSKDGDFYHRELSDHTDIIVDEPTRKVEIDFEISYAWLDEYNDILWDLIQENLVEKVKE